MVEGSRDSAGNAPAPLADLDVEPRFQTVGIRPPASLNGYTPLIEARSLTVNISEPDWGGSVWRQALCLLVNRNAARHSFNGSWNWARDGPVRSRQSSGPSINERNELMSPMGEGRTAQLRGKRSGLAVAPAAMPSVAMRPIAMAVPIAATGVEYADSQAWYADDGAGAAVRIAATVRRSMERHTTAA